MSKASEMFKAEHRYRLLEDEMEEALTAAVGLEEHEDLPWSHISFDDYDNSFEFKCVKGDWTPTPEQFAACWELGFSRCWVCYDNLDGPGVKEVMIYAPNSVTKTEQRREKYFEAPRIARTFPGEL